MTDKNNKKILAKRQMTTWFLVVLLLGSFLFGSSVLAINDYSKATGATPVASTWNNIVSSYDKPINGTLSAPEWNGLFYDFVNTWTTASMTGPLGIGSASPAATLDVSGKLKFTSGGTIYNTDSARWLDMTGTLGESLKVSSDVYSTAGEFKADGTGINYLMGNLGIGTAAPGAYRLYANGASYLGGASTVNGVLTVNSGLELATGGTRSLSYYGSIGSGYFTRMEQTGTASFGTYGPVTSDWALYNRFSGANTRGWIWQLGTTNIAALNGQGSMQIAGNFNSLGAGNNYFTGNLGIGTSTPVVALDVNGLIKMRNYTISQPEDVVNKSYLDSSLASSTASIITQVATSSFWQGSLGGNVYNINTGNIGVGTNNPAYKLDVNGTSNILARFIGTYTGIQGIRVERSGGDNVRLTANYLGFGGGLESSSTLRFAVNNNDISNPAAIIDSTGNVGIGTTNPGELLSLYKDQNAITRLEINNPNIGTSAGSNLVFKQGATTVAGNYYNNSSKTYKIATYATGSDLYFSTVDSERMRITSAGNVGIGSTAPAASLDVTGKLKLTSGGTIYNTDSGRYLDMTGTLTDSLKVSGDIYSTAGELKTDGTGINYVMGNLGVGTNNPAYKLDVNGPIIARGTVDNLSPVGDAVKVDGYGLIGNRANLYITNASASGLIQFGVGGVHNSSPKMTILSSGNVGIGTVTPDAKLNVSGTLHVTGALNSVVLDRLTGTGNRIVMTDASGSLYATSSSIASGLPVASGNSGYTLRSDGTNWVANSTLYNNGTNVGIGTASPLVRFAVVSPSTDIASFQGANNFNYGTFKVIGGTANGSYWRGSFIGTNIKMTSTYPEVENAGFRAAAIGFGSDAGEGYIGLFTTSATTSGSVLTEQVRVSNNGNVGIGSTAPVASLDVTGKLKLTSGGTIYNTDSGRYLDMTGTLTDSLKVSGDIYSTAGELKTDGTGINYVMGNLGVGTNNPAYKLDVSGHIRLQGVGSNIYFDTTGSSASNYIGVTNSYWTTLYTGRGSTSRLDLTEGDIRLSTNSAERIRISVAGNVGIGTTTPTDKLHVIGNATISGIAGCTGNGSAIKTDASGRLVCGTIAGGITGSGTANYTARWTGTNTLGIGALYDNGTNVGIGTTSPAAKLDVAGKIQGKSLTINQTSDDVGGGILLYSTTSQGGGIFRESGTDGNLVLRNQGVNTININNGNVGIGTTSPSASLDVTGKLKLTSGGTIYNADSARWLDMTGTLEDSLKVSGDLFSTAGVLQTEGTARPNYMLGNLGIGTNNPVAKLEILGNTAGDGGWANGGIIIKNTNATAGEPALSFANSTTGANYWITGLNQSEIYKISYGTSFVDGNTRLAIETDGDVQSYGYLFPGTRSAIQASYYLYQNGSGLRTNGQFYVDGNVGIATTTPDAKLNVNGTFHVSGALNSVVLDRLSGTGNRIVMTDASGSLYATSSSIASGLPVASGNSGYTLRSDGTNWVANSTLYNNGTNIGIGTASPSVRLDVNGNTNLEGIRIGSSSGLDTSETMWMYYNGASSDARTGYFGIRNDSSLQVGIEFMENNSGNTGEYFKIKTGSGSDRLLIDAVGNVGIGTTVPVALLDVTGKLKLTSGGSIYNTDSGRWLDMTGTLEDSLKVSGDLFSTAGVLQTEGTARPNYMLGNLGIGTAAPSAKLHVAGSRSSVISSSTSVIKVGGSDVFLYANAMDAAPWGVWMQVLNDVGTSLPLVLNPNGGNVGIGTTTPTDKLHVIGNATISGIAGCTGTGSAIKTDASGRLVCGTIAGGITGSGTTNYTARWTGTNTLGIGALYDNGTNVGIGTTAPLQKLVVTNNFAITNTSGQQYLLMGNQDSAGVNKPSILSAANGGFYMGYGTSWSGNGGTLTSLLSLNGASAKLNISSGGILYNTDNGRWLDMTGSLGDSLKVSADLYSTAGELKTDGTGANYMLGSLGVGTNNPHDRLHVNGTLRVGPYYTDVDRDQIELIPNGTDTRIRTLNEFFHIENTGGPLILQGASGNVGIGTSTTAEAKLVINGGSGMAVKAYGNGIFTGTLQTQTGSDFAEEFSTTKNLEPGTVVVMDDNGHKSVKPCAKSYDKTVVGIVSNDPSIIAGRVESKHKAIIAMMGVVKVKVSDVNGKISKGDLLTTSGITGYAMKAQDSKPGTIIGKALENLNGATGQINVLVNLQ